MNDRPNPNAGSGAESIPCPFSDGGARNWEAWLDTQPGPDGKKLIVIGEVETQEGYSGHLELTHMDKMLPPNQYASLTLVEDKGAPGGWQPIRAELETDQDEFTSVVIDCHGETLFTISPVPVVS